MVDYQAYINALRKCAKEHDNDRTPTGHMRVSDLCRDTADLLEEIEQESSINKPCVSEKPCVHDKNDVLDRVRDELDLDTRIQVKHYMNTDDVIDAVLHVIEEYKKVENRNKK